jgi:hypothetical protein
MTRYKAWLWPKSQGVSYSEQICTAIFVLAAPDPHSDRDHSFEQFPRKIVDYLDPVTLVAWVVLWRPILISLLLNTWIDRTIRDHIYQ